MARPFQCPYCGAHNKVGQRYCIRCGARYYYTCINCNSVVDPSYKYCPSCSTTLNWTVKPRVNTLLQPYSAPRPKAKTKYKLLLMLVAIVIFLVLTTGGYFSYRASFEKPLVFVGYDSWQESTAESEPYVTSPPDSQYVGNPPYKEGPSDSFHLSNNEGAYDVSFEDLKTFIISDQTDKTLYIPNVRMCGYFAETVHNNAERAGIKAAVVIVGFTDGSLHALNAFKTTDKGLVYIDCTGVIRSPNDLEDWLYKLFYPTGQDRMAYLVKGNEYGTIPLEDAESTQYSYYTGYSKGWIMDKYLYFSKPPIVKSVQIYW